MGIFTIMKNSLRHCFLNYGFTPFLLIHRYVSQDDGYFLLFSLLTLVTNYAQNHPKLCLTFRLLFDLIKYLHQVHHILQIYFLIF